MPTEAVLEAARSRHTVLDKRFPPIVPFLNQRLAYIKSVTLNGRASIGTHADLWEARNLLCQVFRLFACATSRGDVFAQANIQALVRRHFTPSENDLQRATLADDPRQSHRSSVN